MNPDNWKIKSPHSDAPAGFPFAIIGNRQEVVGWMKTKNAAEFLVEAASRISSLDSDSTRLKRLWLGQFISRR